MSGDGSRDGMCTVCAQYESVLLAMHVHEQLDLTISANSRVIGRESPSELLCPYLSRYDKPHATNCYEQAFNATSSSCNIAISSFLYLMLLKKQVMLKRPLTSIPCRNPSLGPPVFQIISSPPGIKFRASLSPKMPECHQRTRRGYH